MAGTWRTRGRCFEMIRTFVFALCAAASLAACSPSVPPEPAPDPNAAIQLGEAEALPHTLPALSTAPRFVGMWATASESCSNAAWRFAPTEITTLGEVSCDLADINEIPGGYAIDAMCTAESPPTPYRLQLTFAESARAMMVAGGPWSETALVYCGPLTTP